MSAGATVEKAFTLLEFLAASGRPASLQEVTTGARLSKPTACRLLSSLQKMGYVSRPGGSRHYLVGPRTARLAGADPHSALKAAVGPILRGLYEEFNETVNLGVLSGSQVQYLEYIETTRPLRYIVTPGQSDDFYSTALGRAIASQMDETAFEKIFAGVVIHRHTPFTIKTKAELKAIIIKARREGFAEEIQETVTGVCCVAVSLAPLGFTEAAISIAMPLARLTKKRKAEILTAMKLLINP